MKENSPICDRAAAPVTAVNSGLAQGEDDQECGERIAAHDDQKGREDGSGFAHDDAGIEQHADGHEEQHRERVPQRQRFLSGLLAES